MNDDTNDDDDERLESELGPEGAALFRHLMALPKPERAEAFMTMLCFALHEMPTATVREIMSEVRGRLPEENPLVSAVLDLLEGQLALRQLKKDL